MSALTSVAALVAALVAADPAPAQRGATEPSSHTQPERRPSAPRLELSGPESSKSSDHHEPKGAEDGHRLTVHYEPGHGIEFRTRSGLFSNDLFGRVQLRQVVSAEAGDVQQQFAVRRLRVVTRGHVFRPALRYFVQFGLAPTEMEWTATSGPTRSPLLDAFIEVNHLRDLSVRIGQQRVPYTREFLQFQGRTQLLDRSSFDQEFRLDRDVGLALYSDALLGRPWLRYQAGLFTGDGIEGAPKRDLGLLYTARVDLVTPGDMQPWIAADLERSATPQLGLGVAYAFLDDAAGVSSADPSAPSDLPGDEATVATSTRGPEPEYAGRTDSHHVTLDGQVKVRGFTAQTAVMWRHGERDREPGDEYPAVVAPARSGIGWYSQVGMMLPKIPADVALRYGQVRRGGQRASSLPEFDEATVGFNVYLRGQSVKLAADYGYRWAVFKPATHTARLQLEVGF